MHSCTKRHRKMIFPVNKRKHFHCPWVGNGLIGWMVFIQSLKKNEPEKKHNAKRKNSSCRMTWMMWYHLYKFKRQRKQHYILFIEKMEERIHPELKRMCLGKWMGLEMVGNLELFLTFFFFFSFLKGRVSKYIPFFFFNVVKYNDIKFRYTTFVIEKPPRWFPWVMFSL